MPGICPRNALAGAVLVGLCLTVGCVFVPEGGSDPREVGGATGTLGESDPCWNAMIYYEASLSLLEEAQCVATADPNPQTIDDVAFWWARNQDRLTEWLVCCDQHPESDYCEEEPDEPDGECSAPDAGTGDAGSDAGDAGAPGDAGSDAGAGSDGGVPQDAGTDADAGVDGGDGDAA
jgi:hypothetical protein